MLIHAPSPRFVKRSWLARGLDEADAMHTAKEYAAMAKAGIVSIPLNGDELHVKLRAYVLARPDAYDRQLVEYLRMHCGTPQTIAEQAVRDFRESVSS